MTNNNYFEIFNNILREENIKLVSKIKEDVFKKALISHWLQGEIPRILITPEMEKNWLNSLGTTEKSEIHFDGIPFPPQKADFKFIDLFAGIGGFRLALQDLGGKCVFSSEWNPAAQQTYFNNFGEFPFGDIRDFTSEKISDLDVDKMIPSHDLLAAGFPCQPFSHAGVSARTSIGKSHGFECKTQGTLFFDICRIVKVKRPKILFLENVKNLKNHDKGLTFNIIKEAIDELGYDFYWEIIDASSVVPQHRERCYMVCFDKKLGIDFKFPIFSKEKKLLKTILDKNVPEKFTISDRLWQGHINRTARNIARNTGFTAHVADINKPSNTIVARYGKDGKECLIPQEGKNPRLLTPKECSRLQGFPDDFVIPDSRTAAYQQFGNSVAVPVVKLIAQEILRKIELTED